MRSLRPSIPLLAALLVMQGCVTKPDVRSDYDHTADFSKYRTFNFVEQPSTDKLGYSTLVTQELKSAVTSEMQKRGYTLSNQPDLLVNFSGKLKEKQDVVTDPGPYYGYRVGLYGVWPGYDVGGDVHTVDYTQGTLNVDVVDARTMRMVWEGVTIGDVSKKDVESPESTLGQAVSNVFVKYPFQAGQAQPVRTAEKK